MPRKLRLFVELKRKKGCEEKAAKEPSALAYVEGETKLWSRPSTKQRQNPCGAHRL